MSESDSAYEEILQKFDTITLLEKELHKIHMELKSLIKKYNNKQKSIKTSKTMSDKMELFLNDKCKCKKITPTLEFANKQIIKYIKKNDLLQDNHFFKPNTELNDILNLIDGEKQSIFEVPNLLDAHFTN